MCYSIYTICMYYIHKYYGQSVGALHYKCWLDNIYIHVDNCVYISILETFNGWKIVILYNSSTTEESFDDFCDRKRDGISYRISLLSPMAILDMWGLTIPK